MLKSLSIENFRGFSKYEMPELGRINLLVGVNNCGKSSLLEAIQLLNSPVDIGAIEQIAKRRGEYLTISKEPRNSVDISHFFYGHSLKIGNRFKVSGENSNQNLRTLDAKILDLQKRLDFGDRHESLETTDSPENLRNWFAQFEWRDGEGTEADIAKLEFSLPLGSRLRFRETTNSFPPQNVRFISTNGLNVDEVISVFEDVVLSKEEELVIEALHAVEPNIERIATVGGGRYRDGDRGGIVLKCKGIEHRIPIGSMGDGLWRMLGMALAMVKSANGVLLVDEIDTGLHFTVMDRMWRLIDAASKRLNVQVFATTHSRDCVESLAVIAQDDISDQGAVTIKRIEPERTVSYSQQEIVRAAEHGIEVR